MKVVDISGIDVLIEDDEKYLQINDAHSLDMVFWGQIKSRYMGFEVMFCYHNTTAPVQFLNSIGAELADDCIEMHLYSSDSEFAETEDIFIVNELSFNEFAEYHDKCNPDVYWTSVRIKTDLSRWGIFIMKSADTITGYSLISLWDSVQAEIYNVESDSEKLPDLITHSARYAFNMGKTDVLFMADKDSIQHSAALSAGFEVSGFYQGYKIRVGV